REVLAEEVDRPPVDLRVPGDDPVAERLLRLHPEVDAAVRHEPVELDERPLVDQEIDPLPRGELALLVLRLDALLPSALERELAHPAQLVLRILGPRVPGFRLHRRSASCTSSISTPPVDFGCTKATLVPCAPGRGDSSIIRTPFAFSTAIALATSSTFHAKW